MGLRAEMHIPSATVNELAMPDLQLCPTPLARLDSALTSNKVHFLFHILIS